MLVADQRLWWIGACGGSALVTNRRLWQIGACGLASIGAWIGEYWCLDGGFREKSFFAMLGSEFQMGIERVW